MLIFSNWKLTPDENPKEINERALNLIEIKTLQEKNNRKKTVKELGLHLESFALANMVNT